MSAIEELKEIISDNLAIAATPPHNLTIGDMTAVLLGIVVAMVGEHEEVEQEEAIDTTITFLLSQKKKLN